MDQILRAYLLGMPICVNARKSEAEKEQPKTSATRTVCPLCSQG